MSDRPLGAQISHMLKDRGVEVIFGIPGVHNQELYRGIEEAGLTHVLARHEQGAGFMADGYARGTGKPGVCYVITGPGLCNVMTPMGQAYSDSVPMLVISSCLDETAATRGQLHQMIDQRVAAACVCDWSEEARTAEAAYALIDRALAEFQQDRPRPKHIQVPIAVLQALAPPAPPQKEVVRDETVQHLPPDEIERILSAKKPLFIFGGGAGQCGYPACDVLRALGGASFETYAGRGVVGPYALNFGSYLARPSSAEVIGEADVVVLLGTELAETDLWRRLAGIDAHCIHVDIDPSHKPPEVDTQLICDAHAFLTALLDLLDGHEGVAEWDGNAVAAHKRQWKAEIAAERPGLVPVIDALRKAVPDDTVIYSDMTQFAYAAKEIWPMKRPGFWHHPTGFGTLGYALPAAIGAAVKERGTGGFPVMAIAGDYGFQYTIQELATAVELGLSLPIILWDNGKLGEIEDSMVRAQIAPNAVIQRNPDFLKLAEAYGAEACQPRSLSDLAPTLSQAFAAKVPTIIRLTPALA